MRMALAEAENAAKCGEVPIGAVVVQNGEVIATAHNLRETLRDAAAHAELLALSQASRRLGTWRLEKCDLYVTLEPCPMCAGAILQARIRRLIFGAADPKGGAVQSKIQIFEQGRWNHHPKITAGILEDDCGMILKDFFRTLRHRNV